MHSFEFDEQKSESNLIKHGIDFIDAQRTLLELKLAYERARADRELSLAKIEMIAGDEPPIARKIGDQSSYSSGALNR